MDQTELPLKLKKDPVWAPQRKYRRYPKKYSTYLGLIAHVLQSSPNKMLTFGQLMESLSQFVSGDRRGLENNVRVCLSTNACFVKVPVNPEYPNARRNYWKVDDTLITPKMLRRHFSGMQTTFATLPDRAESDNQNRDVPVLTKVEPCKKFSSSFSIESLLREDPPGYPSARVSGARAVNLLRNGHAASETDAFECSQFNLNDSVAYLSERAVQVHSHCLGFSQFDGYARETQRLCKRPPVFSPSSVYPPTVLTPYYQEHTVPVRKWPLSANMLDVRSF